MIVIRNAGVLRAGVIEQATVVIEGDTIASIGTDPAPNGARVIDANGSWLRSWPRGSPRPSPRSGADLEGGRGIRRPGCRRRGFHRHRGHAQHRASRGWWVVGHGASSERGRRLRRHRGGRALTKGRAGKEMARFRRHVRGRGEGVQR